MTQTQRTPGPWKVIDERIFSESYVGRIPIATLHMSGYGKTMMDANAAFIVTACNAHDELVAALRELVNTADDARASWLKDCDEGSQVPEDLVRLEHSARFARAALAKGAT